jgi:putative membrane protein
MRPLLILTATLALAGPAAAFGADRSAFLTQAIEGDNSEIMLGRLAQQKGADAGTRRFGQALAHDHAQAKSEAMAIAQAIGVPAPTAPALDAEQERSKLDGLTGQAFDREFARYMVQDHRADIARFEQEAGAHQGRVSELANQSIPVLRKHLEMALNLEKQGG